MATDGKNPSRASGVRARAKEAMRAEILAVARVQLAEGGPAGLSFRSVAREVGLASSAVYRYFESRDALLTALIIASYDALGDAVEAAERRVPRTSFAERYRAIGRAVREWAVSEPTQWLLIFGSPIPDYEAPQDTVPAATRLPLALAALMGEALDAAAVRPGGDLPEDVHVALELRTYIADDAPDEVVLRGLIAWTYLLGAVMSEIVGQRHRVVSPSGAAAVYERELDEIVALVGFEDLVPDG